MIIVNFFIVIGSLVTSAALVVLVASELPLLLELPSERGGDTRSPPIEAVRESAKNLV